MANQEDGLGARMGGTFREGLGNQAKAYREYGDLLGRLAAKDVKGLEFARSAVDIYIGAVGKTLSSGVALAGDLLDAGIKRAGKAGSAAATTVAEAAEPAESAPAKRARAKK